MKKMFNISVMESKGGMYLDKWRTLEKEVIASTTKEALRCAAPATTRLKGIPTLTRPRKGLTVYEYSNCKYAVENI